MNYIYSVLLGVVQGLTEFLPISSSGHLFTAYFLSQPIQDFISGKNYLIFSVFLHLASLCAVLVFMYKIIFDILHSLKNVVVNLFYKRINNKKDIAYTKLVVMVFISTLSTIVPALFINSGINTIGILHVIVGFVITIGFLLSSLAVKPKLTENKKEFWEYITTVSVTKALVVSVVIGLVQGVASFPGISRSGSTIVIALFFGFSFLHSMRYSFLLSIPAILGAFVLSLKDVLDSTYNIPFGILFVSMISTFVSALIGLYLLQMLAKKQKLWYFAIYLCVVVIVLVVLYSKDYLV